MWESLILTLGKVFDKVIPDPQAAADAKLKMLELAQSGELAALNADVAVATGQAEVNKVEAANSSLFVSGWRPAVGWVCAVAFACKFILGPLAVVAAALFGVHIILPVFDFTEMSTILLGMLGLGGFRTYEKVKGAA